MTATAKGQKPAKPSRLFPLFSHRNGQWAAKIRGRLWYFGCWDDPTGAERRFREQVDDIRAGREVQPRRSGQFSVRDLVNVFLDSRRRAMDCGELTKHTWRDYFRACGRMVSAFGKTRAVETLAPPDFQVLRAELAKTLGPVALGAEIVRIRCICKFGLDNGHLEKPVKFGVSFQPPSRRALRIAKANRPARMFDRGELHAILDAAGEPMRTMILAALNLGYGNTDVALWPIEAVDLERGWSEFPRPKTGVMRRSPLWAETIEGLELNIADRTEGRIFLTPKGKHWSNGVWNRVTDEFRLLLKDLDLRKDGRSFYSLRHVFATIAGESTDQVAVNYLMGHSDGSAPAQYRERISDERLIRVTTFVRNWLFSKDG
jgi:integrase